MSTLLKHLFGGELQRRIKHGLEINCKSVSFLHENPEKAKPKRWIQPQVVKIDNCIELKLNEKYLLKIEISQVTSLK